MSKTFASQRALDNVSFDVEPGEIRAVVGENGSGKSTLIKILSGYHFPDPGAVVQVGGAELHFGDPKASYQLGCRFVHQDLGLVDSETILDNLSLIGGYQTRGGTILSRRARESASASLEELGIRAAPTARLRDLAPSEKTAVAIARALRTDERAALHLLVLDEPTATLPDQEVSRLHRIVRTIAAGGVGIIYVTHRMQEVFDLAESVTVLRDGKLVGTRQAASLERAGLIMMLLGDELEETKKESDALPEPEGEPVLVVEDLHAGQLRGVSLAVQPGEVVGIAGITGSGRESLLGCIFGAIERHSGRVSVETHVVPASRPDLAVQSGMAFVPSERGLRGAVMNLSARENLGLTQLRAFWRWPTLRRQAERRVAKDWFERLDVRPPGQVERPMSAFSGGNQQKVVLAKWLRLQPRVLLLEEPTQGVDIGAKAQIHDRILTASAEGMAVVVSSSDSDELVALCHRVLVLQDGHLAGELRAGDISVHNIVRTGHLNQSGAAS